MPPMHHQRMIPIILFLALSTWACGLLPGQPDEAAIEETPELEEPPASETATAYRGLDLAALEAYAATFEAGFTAGDDPAVGWSYTVDTLAAGSPPARRRALRIEGVSPEQDPGDVTLTQVGDTQYMTGEGTGEAGCLIFPASYDLEASFLTPDDFLAPAALADVPLDPAGPETVAGEPGTRYTFQAESLGDFTDASGELVLADEGGYVLRYDFTSSTIDSHFMPGQAGQLSWHFAITNTSPGETLSAPDGCAIDLPVMDDATELTSLFGVTTYTTPSSSEAVVAFYEEALPPEGWGRYTLPATQDDTTLLVYARAGEFLNINIVAMESGSEVQLISEGGP
jgi:hypothetical protein